MRTTCKPTGLRVALSSGDKKSIPRIPDSMPIKRLQLAAYSSVDLTVLARITGLFFLALSFVWITASAAAADEIINQELQTEKFQLGKVTVNNRNIFDDNAASSLRFVNSLHRVTREHVIRREIWLKTGDEFDRQDLAEIERNLRRLDLFARVRVRTQASADQPEHTDLIVNTYDRLSLVANAGGSFLGGIGQVTFSVGDKNLFGLGHELLFGYSENTKGELLGSVSYDNVLLWSTDVFGSFQAGQTEEGNFGALRIRNRFQHHLDNLAWNIQLERETTRQDFFEQGVSVIEVPKTEESIRTNRLKRRGHRYGFWRYGPFLTATRTTFDAAIGPQAQTIAIPEDNTTIFAGAQIANDRTRSFRTITDIDSLGFEQDIVLGRSIEVSLGLEHVEQQTSSQTLPSFRLRSWAHNGLGKHNFLNFGIGAGARIDKDEFDAWSVSTAATWFNTRFDKQTIAARLIYESAFDSDELPIQQTLGEDSGLRGYPAREFNDEQSLLLNLEYRVNSGLNLASFEIGALVFFDAGFVAERDGTSSFSALLDEPLTSTGLGLRIGSPQILGSNIIRLDFAIPLENNSNEDFSPTFSFAVGHVFNFRP